MNGRVLFLDIAGNPQRWISKNDAIIYQAKNLVAWSLGEDIFTYTGGISRMTGKNSSITSATIIAVKGDVAPKRAKPPSLNNNALFQRDRNLCAYCGKIFSPNKLTRDHIIPISKGGLDTWTNTVCSCSTCNHKKGNKTLEQLGWELLYVPYVPNRAEILILQNRRILQ